MSRLIASAITCRRIIACPIRQIWTGPLNDKGSAQQYLYCNSAPHELTGIYPSGTTCATIGSATAGYSASYDAWGNETGRTYNGATDTLTYDALNRLTTYSDTRGASEQYVYDASGNRVLKRSTSAGTTTLSVYPSSNEEYDYSSTGTLTSQLHYYTLSGYLIASFDGTNTTYYLTDALGSVLMSFSNSAILGEQMYGPYGNTRYTAGTINTAKGYTGQIQDAVTGLDYYNARYYDPVVGVFLSVDSVQGNMLGFDPYMYVSGNPETLTDPTGHSSAPPSTPSTLAGYDVQSAVNQVVADTAVQDAVAAETAEEVAEGVVTLSVATATLASFGAFALIAFSVYLMFLPVGGSADYRFFYPSNGPQLQPAPTPGSSASPHPQPQPQPSTSGAGQRGGGSGCYGGLNGNALSNFMNELSNPGSGPGHMADHLTFNQNAQDQRFLRGQDYSFFRSFGDAVKYIRLAILYGIRQTSGGRTVFIYNGHNVGSRTFVFDNKERSVQANQVVVVFNNNCQPITAYIRD